MMGAGYEIVGVVNSADEAERTALSEKPDLIVMDIRLVGRRDGIDAALEIYRKGGIRSIFATAHADARTRKRAEAAAPLGWLAKPYAMESLTAVVHTALAELKK